MKPPAAAPAIMAILGLLFSGSAVVVSGAEVSWIWAAPREERELDGR